MSAENATPAPRISPANRFGPPLPPNTFWGFGAALVAVLSIAVFSLRSHQERQSGAEATNQSLDVLRQAELVLSQVKDAETGQRGFLLTGSERYLAPYSAAEAATEGELTALARAVEDNPRQGKRVATLRHLVVEKFSELEATIELRRGGDAEGALALLKTDRGQGTMDRIRKLAEEISNEERALLGARSAQWQEAAQLTVAISLGGSILLFVLIVAAALLVSKDFRAQQVESWLRRGLGQLATELQGETNVPTLGERVLAFLAETLDAQVGVIYLAAPSGELEKCAGYALAPARSEHDVRPSEGLTGQAARDGRLLHVREVPESYLDVASTLGASPPRHLLIVPTKVATRVNGVLELGFLRPPHATDLQMLERVTELVGGAIRAARDHQRLEELLRETQQQADELQTQQEELRASNEELEEQSRVLAESQLVLEAQQSELEETNTQLEEQSRLLEDQKEELVQAQGALAQRAAELERSNQYKSEFLANMSHELRTPLNSSLILAKLLADNKDGNLTEEQVQFAETISAAGNDLLTLINDILDLAKIEAGKVDMRLESIPIAHTVESLAHSFQPLVQERGLTLSVVVDPGVPERLETDAQRLGQILKNLLSNAVKFTHQGEVSLRVTHSPTGTVHFSVRDTGIGIPQEQQGIVFEAFRQADGSTHRKYGGTGLGLSISRDLARLLGGNLSLCSTVDVGSTFTLELPPKPTLAVAPPTQAVQDVPSAAQDAVAADPLPWVLGASELPQGALEDDRNRLTPPVRLILVVEDDLRFAAILRDLAREMNFQCVVATTATEGVNAARTLKPTAIVLDMNLPDHSGLGVLDQLKRSPETRHIPVHVVSVADYSRIARELGAIGYNLKPVKREELVEVFHNLGRQAARSLRRVLVIEDDDTQRESLQHLLASDDVEIVALANASDALSAIRESSFDCVVMDLNLPDLSGYELLQRMAQTTALTIPPVIVYTGRAISRDEEQKLRRYSRSIIIKDARSPERLLDEVTLFLHQVESRLPLERQRMLKSARHRETSFEGRRILVVEDDARNIFALSKVLEPKGAKIEIARNGREALERLEKDGADAPLDLVLMDIMMPEMDGLTAMREIRKRPQWAKLPIIALTAKAMRDDHEKCLQAGANDYIAKPLDVEKLLSLLRVWMPK